MNNIVLILVSVISLQGCGTFVTLGDNEKWNNQIYAGTRASAQGHATQLDVPFSIIMDTVVLPYTIPRTIYNKNKEVEVSKENDSEYDSKNT